MECKNYAVRGGIILVMDGTTDQFMLGWDWCVPFPDRSTGLFIRLWAISEEEAEAVVGKETAVEAATKTEGELEGPPNRKVFVTIAAAGFVTYHADGAYIKMETGTMTGKRKSRDRMAGWHCRDNR